MLDYAITSSVSAERPNRSLRPVQSGLTSVKPNEIVPVEPMESQVAKKAKSKPHASPSEPTASKQDRVIALLRRQQGASITEICEATGWLPHSARGFLSGVVKRRLKIAVTSERYDSGERRYFVAPLNPT